MSEPVLKTGDTAEITLTRAILILAGRLTTHKLLNKMSAVISATSDEIQSNNFE